MRDKAVVRSWGLIGVGVALILMLVGCAVADEFDDAFAAFQRGDYEMAHGLFRPLAEQGDASAQGKLGSMFYEGQGVPQSSPKAERWFKMAAAQGLRQGPKWARGNVLQGTGSAPELRQSGALVSQGRRTRHHQRPEQSRHHVLPGSKGDPRLH